MNINLTMVDSHQNQTVALPPARLKVMKSKVSALKKVKQNFTPLLISSLNCPHGKSQALYWDKETPNLGLRVTANGSKSFIFEASLNNQTIRITLGNTKDCDIQEARLRATNLRSLINQGIDPRKFLNKKTAKFISFKHLYSQHQSESITFKIAWLSYISDKMHENRSRRSWSEAQYQSHLQWVNHNDNLQPTKSQAADGLLSPLTDLTLVDISVDRIKNCAELAFKKQPKESSAVARALRFFLVWCAQHEVYSQHLLKSTVKQAIDYLELIESEETSTLLNPNQLALWFESVDTIDVREVKVYLKTLLITGRDATEIAHLKWTNVDLEQRKITFNQHDGVKSVLPLTPYLMNQIKTLSRANHYIFAQKPLQLIDEATFLHQAATKKVKLDISFDCLKKSFTIFADHLETPLSVTTKIQNLEIKGFNVNHFVERSFSDIQNWHSKIELWILEQARIIQ
jgi:integrase